MSPRSKKEFSYSEQRARSLLSASECGCAVKNGFCVGSPKNFCEFELFSKGLLFFNGPPKPII